MRLLPALVVLSLVPGAAFAAETPRRELRGLWVVRTALVSPAAVDRVVDEAQQAGFNALFVQVRGRGDAFYDSRLVPRSLLLANQPAAFDPFARLLERARARGLEVHAWVNVLLTAHFGQPFPEGHVLLQHPEWVMVPRASAAAAAARLARRPLHDSRARRREMRTWRATTSRRPRSGVRRAPGGGGPRDRPDVSRGRPAPRLHPLPEPRLRLLAVRARGLPPPARAKATSSAVPRGIPVAWDEYRREHRDRARVPAGGAARSERPGLVVSAAVTPDEAQALAHRFQAWPRWLSEGLLDAVVPMAYTPDSRIFRAQVQQARALVRERPPALGGHRGLSTRPPGHRGEDPARPRVGSHGRRPLLPRIAGLRRPRSGCARQAFPPAARRGRSRPAGGSARSRVEARRGGRPSSSSPRPPVGTLPPGPSRPPRRPRRRPSYPWAQDDARAPDPPREGRADDRRAHHRACRETPRPPPPQRLLAPGARR